jgi:Metallo-peptidase family M12B Reprolysin-like
VRNYINELFTALRDHVRVRSQHGADVFDAVYDLDSLVAHELGHTLFLGHQHDVQYAWRHIRGDDFNCIMNYDPAAHAADNHFCGMCNVGLRGWNTGTNGARRFDAYYDDD